MDKRIKFHSILKSITPNVYFQPPTNVSMNYPAIVYSRNAMGRLKANGNTYNSNTAYDVTVIDMNPDSPIVGELLKLRYCEFNRQFVTDGLNHTTLKIYY